MARNDQDIGAYSKALMEALLKNGISTPGVIKNAESYKILNNGDILLNTKYSWSFLSRITNTQDKINFYEICKIIKTCILEDKSIDGNKKSNLDNYITEAFHSGDKSKLIGRLVIATLNLSPDKDSKKNHNMSDYDYDNNNNNNQKNNNQKNNTHKPEKNFVYNPGGSAPRYYLDPNYNNNLNYIDNSEIINIDGIPHAAINYHGKIIYIALKYLQ